MSDLTPIMEGAEVLTYPVRYRLIGGREVECDPSSRESLEAAAKAIALAAHRMGPEDGRVMFTVARRQLGDIAATIEALEE